MAPPASINGTAVANPSSYLEVTGFQDCGPVQAGSYATVSFGLPVGFDLSPSKSAGYWLMITGLSPGVHQLDFGGSSNAFEIPPNCCDSGTFPASTTETINTITVTTPEPASVWSMLLGVLGLSVFRSVRRTRSTPTLLGNAEPQQLPCYDTAELHRCWCRLVWSDAGGAPV